MIDAFHYRCSDWEVRFVIRTWLLFFPFWSKPPNGVPLFYWLEKARSTYLQLTGSTFLLNIMWKGQLRDSPWLALV